MPSWLSWEASFLGNALSSWAIAAGVGVAFLAVARIVRVWISRRLAEFSKRTTTSVDDAVAAVLAGTRPFVLVIAAVYIGSQALELSANAQSWISTITVVALLLQAGFWGDALIGFWLTRYQRTHLESDAARVTTVKAMTFVGRLVLYSVVVLLALDNIPGIQVGTLIASLGVGGIAVALAVQSVLADLFASLSIALDKPFVIGDFIIVGDYLGTVEHIGLKTTRLRSLSGEQLIISNNDLLSSRIRNYKRMDERRVVFTLGVTYGTPREKLTALPGILQDIIESQREVRFDRAHFKEYGAYSLNFEIVYYVLSADYNRYMDIQQAVNLAVYDRFEKEGVEFAFPTRTVHVSDDSAAAG